ncbi:MAG: substrate-binding domain-containing protein, partial [Lachnospiraceae bacterium]|nr:substrate-binding domain-containing protein [Lachnospiraceae bacterium]
PNLVYQTTNEVGHFSMENGYRTTKRLIESGEEFTAVYAMADVLAIGAIRALLESGLRVPEDVSVAGYDGIDVSGYISPSLTTIRQPVEDMAKNTAKLLFDIIAGKKEHQHITFDGELLVRESTKEIS